MRRWERILRRHHVFMEKRESFGHHRWVYVDDIVKILFIAAGKKDVFEKNIYIMSIVFLRSRSYLAWGLARPSFATRWCFYALACD